MVSEFEVPDLIRAAGDRAFAAYLEFFSERKLSPNTCALYSQNLYRFFGWAGCRGFSVETITGDVASAYVAEMRKTLKPITVSQYLGTLRSVFRHLVRAGIIAQNPFDYVQMYPSDVTDESAANDRRFPLLALWAMLANMEEKSLQAIFSDDLTARNLLEFVRWRDGTACTRCGAVSDDQQAPAASGCGSYHCPSCGCTYAVTDGTPFEGLPMALHHALFLMFSIYISSEPTPDNDALTRDRGLESSDVGTIRLRVQEALASERLTSGEELHRAVARKNREMTQDEVARDIIEYGQLEAVRDELLRAKTEGSPVADLPPGMTLDEAIITIEAKIADHDRYVISVEEGYLVSQLAESVDNQAGTQSTATAEAAHEKQL